MDFRPRLVHRIDKDTTGAVLVAKDLDTERRLREAFAEGAVRKSYLALVEGRVEADQFDVDAPLKLVELNKVFMKVSKAGQLDL